MRSSVVQDFLEFLLQKEKGEHKKWVASSEYWFYSSCAAVLLCCTTLRQFSSPVFVSLRFRYSVQSRAGPWSRGWQSQGCHTVLQYDRSVIQCFWHLQDDKWGDDIFLAIRRQCTLTLDQVIMWSPRLYITCAWVLVCMCNTDFKIETCLFSVYQIENETRCSSETAGHCCGFQWPQLHASAGLSCSGEKPAVPAGDQRHSHPQQCHRLCSSLGECQHLTPLWVTTCQSSPLVVFTNHGPFVFLHWCLLISSPPVKAECSVSRVHR